MRHHRDDVLAHAHQLVASYGLGALTMRRLGAELGVQPSAIYHHFANKQTVLAAVAEEILRRGRRPRRAARDDWTGRVREVCAELRDAMLACTDGADVVATVWAFGMGVQAPATELEGILREAGLGDELALVGSRTLLHYVFGHAFEEQTAIQAISAGAVERELDSLPDFWTGLEVVIDGLRSRVESAVRV
jgi:AcrR family transcriptional regulator